MSISKNWRIGTTDGANFLSSTPYPDLASAQAAAADIVVGGSEKSVNIYQLVGAVVVSTTAEDAV